MSEPNINEDWESFAKDNPYWAVLTQERFRQRNLDETTKREFLASGEEYVKWVFETMTRYIDPTFTPQTGLDFGCGVGRLMVPIGSRCEHVVGVDVSQTMLREAELNCAAQGILNTRFVRDLSELEDSRGAIDFINSAIVFQHIPCRIGLDLFRRLLDLLAEGGCAAIHITYSKGWYSEAACATHAEYVPVAPVVHFGLRHHIGNLHRAVSERLMQVWRERSLRRVFSFARPTRSPSIDAEPAMQMNSYLVNPLLHGLQMAGVRRFHAAFSSHSETLGMVLFFQKKIDAPYQRDFLFEA